MRRPLAPANQLAGADKLSATRGACVAVNLGQILFVDAEKQTTTVREQLKAILAEALLR